MFDQSIRLLHGGSLEETREIARAKNKLRKAAKQFNKAHLQRVKSKNCDEAMTPVYTGILYNMDRIGDNCVSIAEESLDHVRLLSPEDVGITAADTARAESE
jgi:phosphate:Na+ symporter